MTSHSTEIYYEYSLPR